MRKKYPHYQAGGPLTVQQRALKKVERDVRRGDPVTFEEGVKSLAPEMLSRDDLKSRLKQLMEEKAKRLRAEDQIKLSGEQQRSGPPMMSQAPMPRASGGILSFQTGGQPPAPTSRLFKQAVRHPTLDVVGGTGQGHYLKAMVVCRAMLAMGCRVR